MQEFVRSLADIITWLIERALMMFTFVTVNVIFVQVFWRYILNAPLAWPEEVAMLCFVWVVFLSLPILVRRCELISVEILWENSTPQVRKAVKVFVHLLLIPALILLLFEGLAYVENATGMRMVVLGLPMGLLYSVVPLSAGVTILFVVERLMLGEFERIT